MRLLATRLLPSPREAGFTRLEADLRVESLGKTLTFWFEFPDDLASELSTMADPWAILMLPMACYFGESIVIDRPIDRRLYDNLNGLQRLWRAWYPSLHDVSLCAQRIEPGPALPDPGRKTIACFSGGIDSLHTFYRHKDRVLGDGHGLIDDLLCIGGLMTSMADFDALRADFEPVAQRLGRRLIPVLINFRYGDVGLETPYSIGCGEWWENMSHAAVIAAVAHLFAPRYKELLVPASLPFENLMPYGSHPLTDPLYGASGLTVTHDGAAFNRTERVAFVAQFDEALGLLHVCGQDRRQGNCSRCEKCLRTMAALDLVGAKARAVTFDWSTYDMSRLSRVWFTRTRSVSEGKVLAFQEIVREAVKRGRADIAAAARASIRYSRRKRRLLALIDSTALTRLTWSRVRALREGLRG